MTIKESKPNFKKPEITGFIEAPEAVSSDLGGRTKRGDVVGIFGLNSRSRRIVGFPEGRIGAILTRRRRASRCNGTHDAEANPCGSPRCRTKGRQKLVKVRTRKTTTDKIIK